MQTAASSSAPNLRPVPMENVSPYAPSEIGDTRAAAAPLLSAGGSDAAVTSVVDNTSGGSGGTSSTTFNNVTFVTNEPGDPDATTYNIENNYYAGDTITYNNISNHTYNNNTTSNVIDLNIVDNTVQEAGDILTTVINSTTNIVNHVGMPRSIS